MQKRRLALAPPTKTPNIETTSRAVTDERSATARLFVTDRFATTAQIAGAFLFIAIIRIPGKSSGAAITQDFAVVFGGRQPAGVVRLALQKSFSKCNLHFLTWWTAKSVMKSSKACCIATKTG